MATITSDRSGVTDQDDRYGWSRTFVPMLARVTRQWPPRDGLTFGIYGSWGSGKSTVLNLLESQLLTDHQKYPNTYVVRFNPWFYDSPHALVMSFFSSVGSVLDTDKGKKWSAAGSALKKLGVFLSVASKGFNFFGASYDTQALTSAAKAVKEVGEEVISLADEREESLRETRDELCKYLTELGNAGGRIMILIDDVDRLDSEELFTLLRLLRTIADLPSITLLVAMDELRVSEVLNTARGRGYGRAYLEKIVQAHVHVPLPAPEAMNEHLRDGIGTVLREARAQIPQSLSTPENCDEVLNRIIRTPRDLVRYLNGLRILTLARPTWDLDATDAIHLAALHVFYPEVYERVRRNKDSLTHMSDGGPSAQPVRTLEWFLTGGEEATKNDSRSEGAAELIREMFGDLGSRPAPGSHQPSLAARRIASFEVFDAYFALDAEPESISRSVVQTLVGNLVEAAQVGNKQEFSDLLKRVAVDQHIRSDLLRSDLISAITILSLDEAVVFAETVLDVAEMVDNRIWSIVWGAYMSSANLWIQKSGHEVTRQITAPIQNWIAENPDLRTRKDRTRMYQDSSRYR